MSEAKVMIFARYIGSRNPGWLVRVALGVFALGCTKAPEPEPRNPPATPASAEAIPAAPLSGNIAGVTFTLRDARYYIDQRPGYEKVDIKLSDVSAKKPCGPLESTKGTSVWLRRTGPARLEPHETNLKVDGGGPWEVHYQIHRDGRWAGNGDANALLVVREIKPDMRLEGELWACFRDANGSCAAGNFSAHYCRIRIDSPVRGTEAMERPPKGKRPPSSTENNGVPDAGSTVEPVETPMP